MTAIQTYRPSLRLCELGHIKIGGLGAERKSKAGNTYRAPEKHSYFTITGMQRTPAGDLAVDKELMDQLTAKYGDQDGKLRQIPIRALSNDLDDIMQSAFVWYGGKTCAARSSMVYVDDDGQPKADEVTWFNDLQTGQRMAQPKVEAWKPEYEQLVNNQGVRLFKLHTVLNVVIAAKEARWGGVYKFRTTSIISWGHLRSSLLHLSQLTGGILCGLPLTLAVNPVTVAPQGKATTVYVVHIELRGPDFQELLEKAMQMAKFQLDRSSETQRATREYKRLLLLPGAETPAEAKDINMEFQPETSGGGKADPLAETTADPIWASVIGGQPEPTKPTETQPETPPATPLTKADKTQLLADVAGFISNVGEVEALRPVELVQAVLAQEPYSTDKLTSREQLESVRREILAGRFDVLTGQRIPAESELMPDDDGTGPGTN